MTPGFQKFFIKRPIMSFSSLFEIMCVTYKFCQLNLASLLLVYRISSLKRAIGFLKINEFEYL